MKAFKKKKPGLVIFDVEGVLIPKNRYLFFGVGKTVGFSQLVKILFYGFLYELGLISLKSAITHVFKAFKGIKIEELRRIFAQIPSVPHVEEVFKKLKNEGWKTALISSGLPNVVIKDLASKLGADYVFGFEVETKDGVLTGKVWGDVIERDGKRQVLEKILKVEKLEPKDCVVVADDRNNIQMFVKDTLKIGYNPDFMVHIKADYVVTGKLTEILPLIEEKPKHPQKLPTKNIIIREMIHASAFFIPILSGLVGLYFVVLLILIVTDLYVTSELARIEGRNLPIISLITRYAARDMELYEFAIAPIFFALGILLTLLLFPTQSSSAAIAIFAVGDSTASIFGRIFPRTTLPFNKGKTLAGST
ncbi:MAG: HAD-IB family phosphatase, partial [Candidatus Bathyarchaeia archaeon]